MTAVEMGFGRLSRKEDERFIRGQGRYLDNIALPGLKGIGESATVGSPPAMVNAVRDALVLYGVRHMDMPCAPARVWDAMQGKAVAPQ